MPLLLVMQTACLRYYIIITYYYVIITQTSTITHYYPFQSPELADAHAGGRSLSRSLALTRLLRRPALAWGARSLAEFGPYLTAPATCPCLEGGV